MSIQINIIIFTKGLINMPLCLIVKHGPDKGKKITLENNEVIIGRDMSADIAINDRTVSRQHCLIKVNNGIITLSDLKSSNKTMINGIGVEPDNEYQISFEDNIKIGETVFSIQLDKTRDEINSPSAVTSIIKPRETHSMIVPDENVTIEKISRNLDLIYKVNSAINSITNTNQLIKTLLELIFEVIPADRGAILIYDRDSKKLVPEVALTRENSINDDIHVSQSISNEVFRNKIGMIIKDAMNDSRFMNKQTFIQHQIRSAMCAPIGTINNMVGVIHLDSKIQSGAFTEKDLAILSTIANQAAIAIDNINSFKKLKEENTQLQKALQKEYNMIGQSQLIQKIFDMISKLSQTDSTILICGESGTGKELVARAIHYTSSRKDKPLVCVNCAALNKNLLESELFGHEKGAFTGAICQKKGRFELADGGTIFLDEIGELNIESQVKLLRILEENKFERVGGTQSISINTRIIAATNRDLEESINENLFRKDLFFRLNVIQLEIPPLRERHEDIIPLAIFFLDKYRAKVSREIIQFSPEAVNLLKTYKWPGNVRELKNCVERAVVLGNSNVILPEDLLLNTNINKKQTEDSDFPTLRDIEREHILKALNQTGWNKKKTADILGIQRSTLYEKLKIYNIAI